VIAHIDISLLIIILFHIVEDIVFLLWLLFVLNLLLFVWFPLTPYFILMKYTIINLYKVFSTKMDLTPESLVIHITLVETSKKR